MGNVAIVLYNRSPCELCFIRDHSMCTIVSDLCAVAPHSINISMPAYLSYITVLDQEKFILQLSEPFIIFYAYFLLKRID
jgi:hypothetical protein